MSRCVSVVSTLQACGVLAEKKGAFLIDGQSVKAKCPISRRVLRVVPWSQGCSPCLLL